MSLASILFAGIAVAGAVRQIGNQPKVFWIEFEKSSPPNLAHGLGNRDPVEFSAK